MLKIYYSLAPIKGWHLPDPVQGRAASARDSATY